MKIKILIGIIVTVIFVIVGVVFLSWQEFNKTTKIVPLELDYKNLTYVIDNKTITLVNGVSEIEAAPGSASKIITKYFGNEAIGDLNQDTINDAAFLLTQETGGSGIFYYVVAVLKNNTGYQVTNTIVLGDRIAPQTTEINNGVITVNYADRRLGEAMTTLPSLAISKYFTVENGILTQQIPAAEFNTPVTLGTLNSVKFNDGLIVMLKEINDSRCRPEMVCVRAGELSPLFIITGENVDNKQQQILLGSTTAPRVSNSGYTFELKKASETTVTIVVSKEVKNIGSCYVGGCSGEICSDKEGMVSVCIYKKEYACYKKAICTRQADGQCAWTQTPDLKTCLNNN